MDEKRYKRIQEKINNTGAADARERAELQSIAARPVQVEQPTQPVRPAQPRQAASVQSAQGPQADEQQNSGRAYQTYEETGEAAPQNAPSPQPQETPNAGGGYVSPYSQQINDLYQQITGRKPFSYNIDEDAMWQSLKADYQQMGQKAMRDTIGRAAGLTGGYGSSYGQAAGQAAYDEYLTQLSERAPELYDRALNRYRQEGDDMMDRLGVMMQRDNNEYNRFSSERAYADERADLEYQRQQREKEYADSRADMEYQRQQKERDYIIGLIQYGYNPTDEDLENAGMTRDEAEQLAAVWRAGNPDMAYRLGLISADDYYRMTGQYPAGYTPPVSETPVETGTGGDGENNSMWDNNTSARGRNARDESNPGRPGGTYGMDSNQGRGAGSFGDAYGRILSAQNTQQAIQAFRLIGEDGLAQMNAGQRRALTDALRQKGVNVG